MEAHICASGRVPRMRNTVYGSVSSERYDTSFSTGELSAVIEHKAGKRQTGKCLASIESQPVRLVQSLEPISPDVTEQVILMAACN